MASTIPMPPSVTPSNAANTPNADAPKDARINHGAKQGYGGGEFDR